MPTSVGITVEEFREHFERVFETTMITEVMEWVEDMRGCEKVKGANEAAMK